MFRFNQKFYNLFLLTIILLFKPLNLHAGMGAEQDDAFSLQRFLDLEIEGITLSTLPADVPVILEAAGYQQSGDSTFIKQEPLPGGLTSVYRIEYEDTLEQRSIFYTRGETGGRNKSPAVRNKPIPGNEADWARAVYDLVCSNVSADIYKARACRPLAEWEIRFGEGSFVKISDQAGAQANASSASTTLSVTFFKK